MICMTARITLSFRRGMKAMTPADDWARLQEIAAELPSTEGAWLLTTYGPRWYRIAARNRLIRETAARDFPGSRCRSAKALAAALVVAKSMAVPGERYQDLRRILALNGGKALGWRQLVDLI
jgi:hypothetical protein